MTSDQKTLDDKPGGPMGRPISLVKVGRFLFFGVVALAPLPFGSIDPPVVAFWCLILGIAAPLAALRPQPRSSGILVSLLLVFVAAYCFVLAQQVGFLPQLTTIDPLWQETAKLLNEPVHAGPTLVTASVYYNLGPPLACTLSLILGILFGSDRRDARRLLAVFAISGALYAVYGIWAALFDPTSLLWRDREGYVGSVIGTFTYRNTAATYFGCCSTVWLLALCETVKELLPGGRFTWKGFTTKIIGTTRLDTSSRFLGFAICIVATLMTNSRAGVVISLAAMTVAGGILFRRDIARIPGKYGRPIAAAIVVVLLLEIIQASLGQRLETSGLSDENRFDIYRSTFRMIADHPWFGVGLGAFPDMFPLYRGMPPSMFGRWEIAHSTPVEMAAELGLPLTILIALGVIAGIAIMLRGALIRRRDTIIPLAGGAIAATAAIHSCIDFPLQIPGFSIVAMAVCGTGLAQSFRTGTQASPMEVSDVDGTNIVLPDFPRVIAKAGAGPSARHRER
jgi:O-antigen ligase